MWVQCQLDHLGTLDRDSARRNALENLPPGLPETYMRIMNKLSQYPDCLQIAIRAMRWLLFSVRPLYLHELAVAAVIDSHEFSEEQKLDTDDLILTYCHSFIKFNPVSKIVEIGHVSVTQYFTSMFLTDGSPNPYYMEEKASHQLILETCFTWLTSPSFERMDLAKHSFEEISRTFKEGLNAYSVHEWPIHGSKVEASPEGSSAILSFLNGRHSIAWGRLWESILIDQSRSVSLGERWIPRRLYYPCLLQGRHADFHMSTEHQTHQTHQTQLNEIGNQ
jgi:hypothetical protein